MSELTEEEAVNLYANLKAHADKLRAGNPDRLTILSLMEHFEKRLRDIAWEKYQRGKGLIPQLLEEKKEEVKEV